MKKIFLAILAFTAVLLASWATTSVFLQQDKGTDITNKITNPNLDDGLNGWTVLEASGLSLGVKAVSSGNPIYTCYGGVFNIRQTIKNLEPGLYTLKVQAFSSPTLNAESVKIPVEEQENNFFVVANYVTQNPVALTSEWLTEQLTDWSEHMVNGQTIYLPNSAAALAEAFRRGMYDNTLSVVVGSRGELTLSVTNTKASSSIGYTYTGFDNFRLYYEGVPNDVTEAMESGLLNNIPSGTMSNDVQAAMEAALKAYKASKSAAVFMELIDAVDNVLMSIEAYKLIASALDDANKTTLSESGRSAFNAEIANILAAYQNHTLNGDGKQEVEAIKAALAKAIEDDVKNDVSGSDDKTALLKNPNLNDGLNGWTVKKSEGGSVGVKAADTGNPVYTCYNGVFNIYQTLTDLVPGTYKLQVQAFFRPCVNDEIDALLQSGKELENFCYIYANDEEIQPVQLSSQWLTSAGSGTWRSHTIGGKTVYLPDNSEAIADAFKKGMYDNELLVPVRDGKLTIGIRNEVATGSQGITYAAFDNFRLYYLGNDLGILPCESPQIAREGTSNQIIITCATAGASIYYTTNGTTPTENNTQYTGPITVSKNCTIKAIAVKDGYESSSVASYSIDWFKVATPTFGYSNLQLTISTVTSGATIYYTTNGSTPTTSSTRYTGAISLTSDCTVKAIAVKDDYTNSDVATYSFVKSNYTCQAPQISRNGTGNQIVMTCATSGASIYYTTDGTTPTQASVRYTGAITFDHNQTIRAVAIKDGMFNSSQTQFSVDWFKVATPTFSYSNLKLTISTATSGAIIYYTIDGSNPLADLSKAIRYTVPVRLEADAQVKSVAVKTDFNNSDVASYTFVKSDYTCKAPQIQRDGSSDRVMMSSATENAVIYYTTDGSEPTTTSTRYTGPVTMTYNCTVRAIAARSDMFSSGVSEFAVDWLTISGVTVAYNNGVLTLTCASSGAEIHYEIGGKDATKSSPLYTGPITLTDNREVRYVIYVTGKEPVSGSYTPTDFTCASVTLSYDGLNIILSTAEEGATIYYTTDGSIPTTSSEIYRGKISLTGLCTVTAFATKQYKNNSEMMSEPITYFFDGRTVFQSEPGHVGDAVQWRGTEGMQELKIQCEGQGVVNDKDLSALRAIKNLKHLDLVDARFENNSVPNGAFAGMNIVSVEFPGKNITTLGNVFSGCEHLAAIIWNARTPIVRTTATAAGITNPNLLLYVDNEAYAPNDVRNVIANGSASSIVLTDSGSYFCPQEFQAQVISYSHTYTQITGINKRSGWETIALPFDVQSITHELQGRIAPFAADDAMARPFWLGELSSSGFKRAAEIKANTPYIISMPNNEVYGSAYILAGKVTFEASNMTVPATKIITTSKGDHVFTPCFDAVEASPSVYAINKNDRNSNHVEGSVFLPDTRDVKPFEAYIAVPTNGVAPRYIPIRDDSDTGIDYLTPDPFQNERVYDLTGRKVQGDLKRGVYIIDGKKVMVK